MYFKPSGKIDLVATPIATLVAVASTFVLAFVYTYAIWYIPLIYLNFLITIFTGVAMIFMINKVCYYSKSRNTTFNTALTVICGILFCYFNWGVWLDLVMNSTDSYNLGNTIGVTVSMSSGHVFSLLAHPEVMFDYAKLINSVGTWGFKSIPVTGWFLTIIWVVEALILIGLPTISILGTKIEPFCETHNEWSEKDELKFKFQLTENPEQLKSALENANYDDLFALKLASDGVLDFTKILLYRLNRAQEYFISISNEIGKLDKEGKVSHTSYEIVTHIKITKEVHDFLVNYKPEVVEKVV